MTIPPRQNLEDTIVNELYAAYCEYLTDASFSFAQLHDDPRFLAEIQENNKLPSKTDFTNRIQQLARFSPLEFEKLCKILRHGWSEGRPTWSPTGRSR